MRTLRMFSWCIKTTLSRQQSESSYQNNNLRSPIIKTAILVLPSGHQSQSSHQEKEHQSSHQDNNLRAPSRQQFQISHVRLLSWRELSDCCLNGSSEIIVLMGALRLLSWWELWDCCLDGSSTMVV
jgi:hypothetical protein